MDKVTKIELEIHEKENGYMNINLTPQSEDKLIQMNYDTCIILSHIFAQLSYSIMAKETLNEIDELCDNIKTNSVVCDLAGFLTDSDDDEIKRITDMAVQSGIDLVKHNMVKDAADIWQECMLGGIASLLGPERNTYSKHHKYLIMIPEKSVKLNDDYVKYYENTLINTRNYYPSNMTSEEIEGYIANILSLVVEKHISEYSESNKKIPDKKFFDIIQQHMLKITTEALSVIISQIKDAYKESKTYTQLNKLTNISPEEEAELTQGIDFRDILKSYKDNINNLKKKDEDDEDEKNN